jgi:citrate synthase
LHVHQAPFLRAESLEQLKNNRIYRPEQVYVGKHDRAYVPLEQRP